MLRIIQEGTIKTEYENSEYLDQTRVKTKVFQEVYPFTTENVAGYFPGLELRGKSLLTVGSSLDQAFNGLVLGASKVTVYDLNANTEKFYKIKRNLVLTKPREEFYSAIMNVKEVPLSSDVFEKEMVTKFNSYLQDDKTYELLKKRLKNDDITFVCGDIFDMHEELGGKKYDRMVLSNILQYLDFFACTENPYQFLSREFEGFKSHLNDDGILQLLYLYDFDRTSLNKNDYGVSSYNLKRVAEHLKGNPLMIEWIDGCSKNTVDAVVTYTKKRK